MLTEDQKLQIVACVADGFTQRVVAEEFGISQQMVSKLVRHGAKSGRYGGDRRSERYRNALVKRAKKRARPTPK